MDELALANRFDCERPRLLIYRGHAGTVGRNNDPSETGCYFCTAMWGSALK